MLSSDIHSSLGLSYLLPPEADTQRNTILAKDSGKFTDGPPESYDPVAGHGLVMFNNQDLD